MVFMDKFLLFWTHYNTQIIQSVIAVILIMVTFLVWGALVSPRPSSSEESTSASGSANAAEIEKTLQKILENQANRPVMVEGAGASLDPAAIDAAVAAQTAALKKTMADKEAMIKQLEAKVQEAEKAGAAASAGAAGGGGNSAELDAKIKDLEARLQEYEIIAEDISDLAKFREENDKLKKELEALRAGAKAAPAPAAPAAAAAPAPAAPTAPTPEPTAAPAAAPAPAAESTEFAIDDELMKEFAAAVEGQKSGALAEENAVPPKAKEEGELMDSFGEFVAKKS